MTALALSNISKRFGATQANAAVDLAVAPGSIHGLVGENGAGKSTLMSIVAGLMVPDQGEIRIEGRPVRFAHPAQSRACGIGMVHQHFMLVDRLDALDNILLGEAQSWWLPAARQRMRRRLTDMASTYGLSVPLDVEVGRLSVGERQRVEILKALVQGARLLILDEPTAVLTPPEAQALFRMMRALRDRGHSIVFVSHKLPEILAVTDEVSVMRQGSVVLTAPTAQVSAEDLARAIMGHDVPAPRSDTVRDSGAERLAAEDLRVAASATCAGLDALSLHLRAGEIVGIAGIAGNGQTELLEALMGLRPIACGEIRVDGERLEPRHLRVAEMRRRGFAYVPEDRLRCGLVADMSARDQFRLGHESDDLADLAQVLADWDVRPADPARPVRTLSGGNQQKLLLARELRHRPRVLLIAEPTRGVDLGATRMIHDRLRDLRNAGCPILLVSSDLDELLSLAGRILVLHRGRIVGTCRPAETDRETLGLLMTGQRQELPA